VTGAYAMAPRPPESGFVGAIANLVGDIIDWSAGGPQKRERAAKAAAKAEQAKLEQLKLEAQIAQAQSEAGREPPMGIPWVVWAGLAAGAYLVLR